MCVYVYAPLKGSPTRCFFWRKLELVSRVKKTISAKNCLISNIYCNEKSLDPQALLKAVCVCVSPHHGLKKKKRMSVGCHGFSWNGTKKAPSFLIEITQTVLACPKKKNKETNNKYLKKTEPFLAGLGRFTKEKIL